MRLALGAKSFFANPPPATSASHTTPTLVVLSRFHSLAPLRHPHLAALLSLARGRHERLTLVSEYATSTLDGCLEAYAGDAAKCACACVQLIDALACLEARGVAGINLAPRAVLTLGDSVLKIADYAMAHITDNGALVDFDVVDPRLAPPEGLDVISPKADVWALGLVLAALWLGTEWQLSLSDEAEPVEAQIATLIEPMPPLMASFVALALAVDVEARPLASELLSHPWLAGGTNPSGGWIWAPQPVVRSLHLPPLDEVLDDASLDDILAYFPIEHASVTADAPASKLPSIARVPRIVRLAATPSTARVASAAAAAYSAELHIIELDGLARRLTEGLARFKASCETQAENGETYMFGSPYLAASAMLVQADDGSAFEPAAVPLVIREADLDYQLARIFVFTRILRDMPHSRVELLAEARIDVPPLLRGEIWAAILGLGAPHAVAAHYHSVDKVSPHVSDHQIAYDDMLATPLGHAKLTRVIKRWTAGHSVMVYWQGLDSVAAPFVRLLFHDEALAYGCLEAVINKHLADFFVEDNSVIMRKSLAAFSALMAFHFPRVAAHLLTMDFRPELYAIPWFLTLFAHVFPIDSLVVLWDTLLLGHTSLKFFVALALVEQMQSLLVSADFSVCILAFSELPNVDFELAVTAAKRLFAATPPSIRKLQLSPVAHLDDPVEPEWSPRIAPADVLAALRASPRRACVLDIRLREHIVRDGGTLQSAVVIPYPEVEVEPSRLLDELPPTVDGQGVRIVAIVASAPDHATNVAQALVAAGLAHVAIVDGGWEALAAQRKARSAQA
ncbi:serine/threonine protein kinase [Thecamonas trahens ATCC 50062]|uniref:Serine/threonine protein kinase n=1 Tax=Thecamonas trahens ATCC 50062 TaxID=461836 RepID=A0A0L0DTT9_THETB|nr:serine/threonine protein kinase [Thecamonas trahens ATCC 50062]KNC55466.1 serine/threonine protein kinase [Thecamonas trahens ATCC 50062]|eukprot:XP_013761246.1 serine/threonine protein kinase [Thecamonas trahens ATCC 50062]